MAILKSESAREIEVLEKIERRIERRERREKIYRLIIAGFTVLAATALVTSHYRHCRRHTR